MPVAHVRTYRDIIRKWKASLLCCAIITVALAIRLVSAPATGYQYDVDVIGHWAKSAVTLGIAHSYEKQIDGTTLPTYPPLSIAVFAAAGHLYKAALSPDYDLTLPVYRIVMKLPAIVSDVGVCILLFFLFRRYRGLFAGTVAGLLYALHPAVIYDSGIWGQTDGIYMFAILAALFAATYEQWLLAGAMTAVAVLLKPQAVIVLPVMALLLLHDNRRLGMALIGGTVLCITVLFPFAIAGNLSAVLRVYIQIVGQSNNLTNGSFNAWFALYGDKIPHPDINLFFGAIPYRTVGTLVFGSVTTGLLALFGPTIWLRKTRSTVFLPMMVTGLIGWAFFLFNTEMHERYLFPITALMIPLIFTGPSGIMIYGLSSALFFLNLLSVLPWTFVDRALFQEFQVLREFIGTMELVLFILAVLHILHIHRTTLVRYSWKTSKTKAMAIIRPHIASSGKRSRARPARRIRVRSGR